jgi:hypothetical protein
LALALIAGATLVGFYALDRFQHRFVRAGPDLLKLLPDGDATVFYARLAALRRAGMLSLLATAKPAQDPEYESFVRSTRFDYTKDLDAIAGSANEQGTFVALKGRFDWDRIRSYVSKQGGTCADDICQLRGSSPGNWIGTRRIQPDVMAIAFGSGKSLIRAIHPGEQSLVQPLPPQALWIKLAPHLLKNPALLPAAMRIFLISLQPARSVMLALGPAPTGSTDAFEIELNALCPSPVTADIIRKQLEIQTKILKLELAHEHVPPNPADLTGLLTSGTFDANGNEVRGDWRVRKELLKALQ